VDFEPQHAHNVLITDIDVGICFKCRLQCLLSANYSQHAAQYGLFHVRAAPSGLSALGDILVTPGITFDVM